MSIDITTITELAKQGGRLSSDKQWVLADALTQLTPTQISQVAIGSQRNESTLLQYARAAERWDPNDRVEGVSFSAHRVALSWHDPRGLLVDLKHKYGSPTVRQVRQHMGLEGHPAIELGEKMLKKMDRNVSLDALSKLVLQLGAWVTELSGEDPNAVPSEPEPLLDKENARDLLGITEAKEDSDTQVQEEAATPQQGTWTPPIRTSDLAGI